MDGSERSPYVIPRYRAPEGSAFYHFLHGTVPGHQIDFMYCPEVPQGALAQTHFGHLSRLMKYIEPRGEAAYAFALGNLSRDDIQHEPGHGGVAILFALRVPGVTDHAGRDMPPYAHGVVAIDRALDQMTLLEAINVLYDRFLKREGADDRRHDFYRAYVRTVQERPDEVEGFLAQAIAELADIQQPAKSKLGFDFVQGETIPPARITILHDDDEQFFTIAHFAAFLGSILYRSDIKWTSITTGREIDIPGGTTIRFIPRSEAASDIEGTVVSLDDLPEDEDGLVSQLFGAKRRTAEVAARRQGWREKLAAQRAGSVPDPQELLAGGGTQPLFAKRSSDPAPRLETPPPIGKPASVPPPAAGATGRRSAASTDAVRPPSMDPLAPSSPAARRAESRASSKPGARSPESPMAIAPPSGREPTASSPVSDVGFRVARDNRRRRSKWVIVAAALAAVAVIVMVVVFTGLNLQGPLSGSGKGAASAAAEPSATAGAAASPPLTGATAATPPPVASAAATTSSAPFAPPSVASAAATTPSPPPTSASAERIGSQEPAASAAPSVSTAAAAATPADSSPQAGKPTSSSPSKPKPSSGKPPSKPTSPIGKGAAPVF